MRLTILSLSIVRIWSMATSLGKIGWWLTIFIYLFLWLVVIKNLFEKNKNPERVK
ncbi:MAG: hypothetical protein JST21_03265 [Bacteroidetes bacterium]|nr:hypothetical protein [Bacteroidota bacterium]